MKRGLFFAYVLILNAVFIFSNDANLFAQSNKRDIEEFSFPEQTKPAKIGKNDVKVEVFFGANLDSLIAEFELSKGANAYVNGVHQVSGVTANDFTNPVTYTVVAEDEMSTKDWKVTVSVTPNTEADIISYSFVEQTGPSTINYNRNLIEVEVVYGSDVNNLVATFTLSENASATVGKKEQISGETSNNFSNPVTYVVTAEDEESLKAWIVIVTVAENANTDFLTYSFTEQSGTVAIDTSNHTVNIEVEFGTDITDLVASFTLSDGALARIGSIEQESGTTSNNFVEPVTYTITAMDGVTVQDWVVSVTVKRNNEAEILTYSIMDQTGDAVFNANAGTIDLEVVYGIDLTSLIADFTLSQQAVASIEDTEQISGVSVNDFSSPVIYTVTAGDGTVKVWIITVIEAPNTKNDFITYSLPGQAYPAVIDTINNIIDIDVDYNTELENLIATFTLSPQATARIDGVFQESGNTSNNFTEDILYQVTSGALQTTDWEVRITVLPNNGTDIVTYSFEEQTIEAEIDTANHTIKVEVEYGIDLTSLVATFSLSSEATVYVGAVVQQSGISVNDFTIPVTYNVRAGDGVSVQDWKVFVDYKTPNDSTEFISFSFEEQVGTTVINPIDNEIYVLVSEGTSPIGLIASFELSTGAKAYVDAVPQLSGVNTNDFSEPLIYTVIAEDGIMEQDWLVYVSSEFDFNYVKEPLAFPVSSNTIQASVNVPNYASMDKVTFHHRKIEELTWTETEVVGNLRIYSVDITRGMSGKMGMYYYFDAIDTIGNNIALEPKQLVIHYDKDYPEIPNLRFGETVNQYQIVSIPLELVNKNAGSVFDELGEYDIKYWRLFSYNSSLSITNEYNRGFTNIEPGLGYWFIAREPTDIYTGEGYTVEVDTLDGYEIDLLPGWNQIGNPFDADISWDDVRTDNNNLNIGRVKLFNRDSLSEGDLLPKFRGGFVFLSGIQPITVNVRPTRINTIARKKSNINEDKRGSLDNSSWIVGLKITNGVVTNTLSGIGMHPEAEEGLDYHDEVLLPVPKEIVPFELIFNHPEERYDKFSMDVVPTRTENVWEFEVNSYGPNKKLTISWDNTTFGNNKYQMLLNHKGNEAIVDMNKANSYTFNSAGQDEFRIVYGDESFIQNELKPHLITLGNGYPNPFKDRLTIPFTLSEEESEYRVDISLYDLKGRRVEELISKKYSPGYYFVNLKPFDGSLDPGIYIIQMKVQSNQLNQIIIRKVIHQ